MFKLSFMQKLWLPLVTSLLALLTDQPLPPQTRWVRDTPTRARALSLTRTIAEDHSIGV